MMINIVEQRTLVLLNVDRAQHVLEDLIRSVLMGSDASKLMHAKTTIIALLTLMIGIVGQHTLKLLNVSGSPTAPVKMQNALMINIACQ